MLWPFYKVTLNCLCLSLMQNHNIEEHPRTNTTLNNTRLYWNEFMLLISYHHVLNLIHLKNILMQIKIHHY